MRVPNMRKYVIIGLASYLILQFHSRETKEISLEGWVPIVHHVRIIRVNFQASTLLSPKTIIV